MFSIFLKQSKLILTWGIILGLAALAVSLFLPRYYSADSQVLIISRDRNGVDPYTQVKSAERISENLIQVVKTTDFYGKVMESVLPFNHDRWTKLSDRDARKQWQKDVDANVVYNTGLMNIRVYSTTKDDAAALSAAVTDAVVSRGWEYVGGDVALKAVNSPLVSRFPSRPNYVLNFLGGFVIGLLFACFWVVRSARAVGYGKNI